MNLEQMSKELYGLQQSKTCKKPGSMKKELKFQKEKVARIKELQVGIQLAKDQIIRDEALQKTKEEEARKNSVLGQFKGNPLVFKATKSGVNADVKEGPKTVSDATKASSGDQAAKNTHASYAGAVSGIKAQQVLEPIEFCPPVMLESGEKVVIIKQEYVEKVKQIFQKHLYGYFVGTVCSLAWVRVNLYKMWKKYGIVEVSTNGKGLFYFKFKSDEGMNEALKAGPWVVNGIPLVVKKWEVGVNLEKTEPAKVPVWITFKNVPLELWNVKGLCEIASCIGQPLLFDNVTVEKCKQKKGMSGFARILVEIPVMEVMPDKVRAFYVQEDNKFGASVDVLVEFQKVPVSCSHCKVFGHKFEDCNHRELTEEEKSIRVKKLEAQKAVLLSPKKSKVVDEEGYEMINRRSQNEKYLRRAGIKEMQGKQWNKFGNKKQQKGDVRNTGNKVQQKVENYKKTQAVLEEQERNRKGKGVKSKQEYKVKNDGSRSCAGEGSGINGLKMENSFEVLDQCMEDDIGDVNMINEDKFQGINNQQQVASRTKNVYSHHIPSKASMLPKEPITQSKSKPMSTSVIKPSSVHSPSDQSPKPSSLSPNNPLPNNSFSQFSNPPDPPFLGSSSPPITESSSDINMALMDILTSNPVLQQSDLDLSHDQVNEVMGLVINRIKLSKELELKWSFEQYKLYVEMCRRYNFSEGLNDDEYSEAPSDFEVESDENENAQDMKMDDEFQSQNAQVSGGSGVTNSA
ncbi:putative transcription factor interactor and regulator CCHC(Zn) family [Helianthus annuus]|nr:putative transcription factor interactor and regulator CCHC(Zn) family [Helianthus annuus]